MEAEEATELSIKYEVAVVPLFLFFKVILLSSTPLLVIPQNNAKRVTKRHQCHPAAWDMLATAIPALFWIIDKDLEGFCHRLNKQQNN